MVALSPVQRLQAAQHLAPVIESSSAIERELSPNNVLLCSFVSENSRLPLSVVIAVLALRVRDRLDIVAVSPREQSRFVTAACRHGGE